ncbi:MAG: DUF1667 domain-containing protein [Erysipelotrichaceae bacterium]|jgi:CxxC motif-containing protein|nr:DUF1667 domain-containing protein [Erysipelotrichaceae bacterium]
MKELICIVCPRGCVLKVDKQGNVTGNLCPRGIKYGIQETTNPLRNITSSIKVSNRPHTLVSVKASAPIPKDKIFDVMTAINALTIEAPTEIGQVVKHDLLGLGVNIIITKKIV